jgi:hypothetical protein
MALGNNVPGLSAAGQQLFSGTGMGDMLRAQTQDETDELRRRRLAQMSGRPDLGGSLGFGSSVLGGPSSALGLAGRLR